MGYGSSSWRHKEGSLGICKGVWEHGACLWGHVGSL